MIVAATSQKLSDLLKRTSRTFAIAIPLLPPEEELEVTLAYLVLRIADTVEDASRVDAAIRAKLLRQLDEAVALLDLDKACAFAEACSVLPLTTNQAYAELLAETPSVFQAIAQLPQPQQTVVIDYARRTILGMENFVVSARRGDRTVVRSTEELREYCYLVAGLVGEMLTELFLIHTPALQEVAKGLMAKARYFGEALQLTNVLKDSIADSSEGRYFLHTPVLREQAFELALEDVQLARAYVRLLEEGGAPQRYIAFTRFPLDLAEATLDRVRLLGSGAKISREYVQVLLHCVLRDCALTPAHR
jgi:farnesyl-diphosphate farnesyltransferase